MMMKVNGKLIYRTYFQNSRPKTVIFEIFAQYGVFVDFSPEMGNFRPKWGIFEIFDQKRHFRSKRGNFGTIAHNRVLSEFFCHKRGSTAEPYEAPASYAVLCRATIAMKMKSRLTYTYFIPITAISYSLFLFLLSMYANVLRGDP